MALVLSACASVPKELQLIGGNDKSPQDILEDYNTPSMIHLFPANVASILEKNPKKAKDLICSANGPNLKLTLNVKLLLPKPASNQPIDVASKAKVDFLQDARDFLKYRFFFALAKTPQMPNQRNDRTQYDIPLVRDASQAGIEAFYKNLKYQPSFYERRWLGEYGGSAHYDNPFFAFIFSDRRIFLVPKVSEFALVTLENKKPVILRTDLMTVAESNESLPVVNIGQNEALHNQVAVVPSNLAWQNTDQSKFHTLHFVKTDLGILMNNYTFAFPQDVVKSRFHVEDPGKQMLYGLDFEKHKPIASKMIEERAYIWEAVAREGTTIKEHVEPDQVLYEITLSFSDFCSYGVLIENLRSE